MIGQFCSWSERGSQRHTWLQDDVIKWKHFPRHWTFVWGIHRSPVNSPHKGQWRGALMFSLICAWIDGCVNNREAGDLRRHHAHYDVMVMWRWHLFILPSKMLVFWLIMHWWLFQCLDLSISVHVSGHYRYSELIYVNLTACVIFAMIIILATVWSKLA